MSVDQLINDAPFEIETIKLLESHVAAQKAGNAAYHYQANKTLLKSYQYNGGDCIKAFIVADVLVLGLMQLPNTDFFELSYLIPTILLPRVKGGEKSEEVEAGVKAISVVVKGAKQLEQAQFTSFWSDIKMDTDNQSPFLSVCGFEDAIRSYILTNITNIYKNMSKAQLMSLLGYEDETSAMIFLNARDALAASANNTGEMIAFKQNEAAAASKKGELNLNIGDMLKFVESIRQNN